MAKKNNPGNKVSRTTKLAVGAIFIAAILLIGGYYIYVKYYYKEAEPEEVVEPKKIDNRTSPYTNQGLILEIKRIRDRDLLDIIMKPGNAWKTKPVFYYIADIDDQEHVSKDEGVIYNTWDTILMETKVFKDVEEQQNTSDVTVTIIEEKKTGLFGRRTQEIELGRFQVMYDYRTGRWDGDDKFGDDDGYGHYITDQVEVWFNIYQTDYDWDGIPYWTEVNVLHTDPGIDDSKLDPDRDGVSTAWEWKWGYDPFVWDDHKNLDPDIDGIENIEEYQMAKYLADPFVQDIYIEADGMPRGKLLDWDHVFWEESQQIMIERFTRHGINVYIDDGWPDTPLNGGGEFLPFSEVISQPSGEMLQFYEHHFPDERKGIFRYLVIGYKAGFCHPSKFNRYDTMAVGSGPMRMLMRRSFTTRTHLLMLAAAVMHETGHSLGVASWTIEGCDNNTHQGGLNKDFMEKWGNYYSIMNYYYIYDKKLVDYSDGSNGPPYDQNDWETFYLPHFQMEGEVFEDTYFEPPGTEQLGDEIGTYNITGWRYCQNLTKLFIKENKGWTPIEPVQVNISVLVKDDVEGSTYNRNIRLYAQPQVPYAGWSLIREGYLDAVGMLQFVQDRYIDIEI